MASPPNNPLYDLMAGRMLDQLRLAPVSGVPQTITTGDAIHHNGFSVVRVTEAGNVTGIIVDVGQRNGQILFIQNEANQTITMATAATSNVFGGTAIVIPASRSALLRWELSTANWYAVFSG